MATPDPRMLYGVRVPAEKYDKIKTLTEILVGESDHREYLSDARRRCVLIALQALEKARTPEPATPPEEPVFRAHDFPAIFDLLNPKVAMEAIR